VSLKHQPRMGIEEFPKNKKKILIVDDDETILHMLGRFLNGRGFQVLAEKNGLRAVERLKEEKPALVLTDLKMPSFSGMDLIKFIRQNMRDIPIVVMTAYPYLYPEKRNGNEVEAYFVKPFDVNEMLSSIERILGSQLS